MAEFAVGSAVRVAKRFFIRGRFIIVIGLENSLNTVLKDRSVVIQVSLGAFDSLWSGYRCSTKVLDLQVFRFAFDCYTLDDFLVERFLIGGYGQSVVFMQGLSLDSHPEYNFAFCRKGLAG